MSSSLRSALENSGDDEALVVSPRRAEQLLGISKTTLYELLGRGEIKSFTLGKSRKITLASIRALIERRVAEPDKKLGSGRSRRARHDELRP
jgi:excisionase family DNA binding protein